MFEQHFLTAGYNKDVPPAAKDLAAQTVWAQCDAPLRLVEPDFVSFAKEHGLVLRNGSIGWPSRTLEWSSDIDRVIQLYLDDKSKLTFTLVVGAKSDRGDKRFMRIRRGALGPILESLAKHIEPAQKTGHVSSKLHPYIAAAALGSILERLSAYHNELTHFGASREDVVETCAFLIYHTLTGARA